MNIPVTISNSIPKVLSKKHSKTKKSKHSKTKKSKHSKTKKSKTKKSKTKKSKTKKSKTKGKKSRKVKSSKNKKHLNNSIKTEYDIALKIIGDETKLKINGNTLHGIATKEQLEKMPWMSAYCVKPLWSVVPEPYTFDIVFEKTDKVRKILSVYNGSINLLHPSKLLLDLSNCN